MTELQTITGSNQQLKSVYKHRTTSPSGFPTCMIYSVRTDNEPLTNRENQRTITVSLAVALSIADNDDAKGNSDAEDRMDDVVDQIVTEFENNLTLDGTVDWVNPVITEDRRPEDFANGKVLVQFIELQCVTCASLSF